MRIFNSMTKVKEEFIPIEKGKVKIYVCGPTLYNYIHLGNARPFVIFDTVRRYFEYKGYEVIYVQNFTDIDDKIIKKAYDENCTINEITLKYKKEAIKDMDELNIKRASYNPCVTEEIDSIILMIKKLIEKGFAYYINGSVYFDTEKYKEYGKLSKKDIKGLEVGARVGINIEKSNPKDFILWKPEKNNEIGIKSPWGEGRPGWHIECSAMIKKYLGDSIDIHGGGEDLIFPHHENELAQSECANDEKFVNYWMHNGFINVNNEKMSKSKDNFFIVRDIANKYSYNTIRFFILMIHYRSPINFSLDLMEMAENSFDRINKCIINLKFMAKNCINEILLDKEKKILDKICEFEIEFENNMDDDFNTADAISCMFELIKFVNKNINNETSKELIEIIINKITKLCDILGLVLKQFDVEDYEIKTMIEKRQEAKKIKNFELADKIREDLLLRGVILEDTKQGIKWYKKR